MAFVLFGLIQVGATAPAWAVSQSRHPAPISKSSAAKQYLTIVAPVNAASRKFNSEASRWTSSTTDAQASSDAEPLIRAILKLNTQLSHDRWPASSMSDIKSLVSVDNALIAGLRSLATVNVENSSSVLATLQRDRSELGVAANRVRQDLGLTPVKG